MTADVFGQGLMVLSFGFIPGTICWFFIASQCHRPELLQTCWSSDCPYVSRIHSRINDRLCHAGDKETCSQDAAK